MGYTFRVPSCSGGLARPFLAFLVCERHPVVDIKNIYNGVSFTNKKKEDNLFWGYLIAVN
jgi:hypothetical protein